MSEQIQRCILTRFVSSGTNKVCLKGKAELLQGDGALGSRYSSWFWRTSFLLPC